MNFKTTAIAIALMTLLTSTSLFSLTAPSCINTVTDENGCGGYPPIGCWLVDYSDQTRDCCGPGLRQGVKKEWYYCGGCTPVPPATDCPDCEYDIWLEITDSTCP
jgi:hypothetical protein